jgi:hypothetical protein
MAQIYLDSGETSNVNATNNDVVVPNELDWVTSVPGYNDLSITDKQTVLSTISSAPPEQIATAKQTGSELASGSSGTRAVTGMVSTLQPETANNSAGLNAANSGLGLSAALQAGTTNNNNSAYNWNLPTPPQITNLVQPTTPNYVAYNASNPMPTYEPVDYSQTYEYGNNVNGLSLPSYESTVTDPIKSWNYETSPAYTAKKAIQDEALSNALQHRGINSGAVAANEKADLARKLVSEDYNNEYSKELALDTGKYSANNSQYNTAYDAATAEDVAKYNSAVNNSKNTYSSGVNQYNSGLNALSNQYSADTSAYNLGAQTLMDQYNTNLSAYKDLYNTQLQEANTQYDQLLNATKIGQGAATNTASLGQSNTNNVSNAMQNSGNASGTAASTVGNNNGKLYSGLGTVASNLNSAFQTAGLY